LFVVNFHFLVFAQLNVRLFFGVGSLWKCFSNLLCNTWQEDAK